MNGLTRKGEKMLTFKMNNHIGEPPLDPPEPKPVYCPVCREEAYKLYRGYWNDILGCDNCVTEIDVDEYEEDNDASV